MRAKAKAAAKAKPATKAKVAAKARAAAVGIVVFGKDDAGKPHASLFSEADAALATKAAGLMGMQVLRPVSDKIAALKPQGFPAIVLPILRKLSPKEWPDTSLNRQEPIFAGVQVIFTFLGSALQPAQKEKY